MSYVVRYDGMKAIKPPQAREKRGRGLLWLMLSAAAVLVFMAFPALGDTLRSWLIPGTDEVTIGAVHTFMDMLSEGEPAAECFTAFCQEVLRGG